MPDFGFSVNVWYWCLIVDNDSREPDSIFGNVQGHSSCSDRSLSASTPRFAPRWLCNRPSPLDQAFLGIGRLY